MLELTEAQYLYTTATVAEAAEKVPALVLDKVISALAPEGYKLDRMVFQNQDVFVNISSIVSNTPKSTLQALMMVMVYSSFAPYISGSIVSFACSYGMKFLTQRRHPAPTGGHSATSISMIVCPGSQVNSSWMQHIAMRNVIWSRQWLKS